MGVTYSSLTGQVKPFPSVSPLPKANLDKGNGTGPSLSGQVGLKTGLFAIFGQKSALSGVFFRLGPIFSVLNRNKVRLEGNKVRLEREKV
jgi:hypothetical protein